MVADQRARDLAVGSLPEKINDAEAYDDLSAVEDFVTTVAHIEKLTGLNFETVVRDADICPGGAEMRVLKLDEVELRHVRRRRRSDSRDSPMPKPRATKTPAAAKRATGKRRRPR